MEMQKVELLPRGWADNIMNWIVNGTPEEEKKFWDNQWKKHEERVSKLQNNK